MLVPWTALQPSQRARRWRQVGLGIAAASSIALLAAAVASRPFSAALAAAALAALAAIAAAIVWVAAREHATGRFEVGVATSGEIKLRKRELPGDQPPANAGSTAEPPLRVSFAAPWLISLRRGTMLIPIWPDSLPYSVYRQLWVHLHWGRAVPNDDDQQSERTSGDKFTYR